MTFRRMVFYIVILVLIIVVGYSVVHNLPAKQSTASSTVPAAPVISTANYSCDNSATIAATFTTNSATLVLSDGRHLVLPQSISADGAQYQQGNVLFVTKGDQAFLQENGTTTYSNCLAGSNTAAAPSNGLKTFTDQGKTFTFSYPDAFNVTSGPIGYTNSWKQNNTDNTLGLVLTTINVPKTYEPNTNFGDATFTVGTSADPKAVKDCLVQTNAVGLQKSTVTINGMKYTKFTYNDAGAGQRYDTTSYRTVQNSQCYAIEYTVHYADINNYPPNTVSAFDEQKVTTALDSIVQSFSFLPQQH